MWVKQCRKPSPKSAQTADINHSQNWVVSHCFVHVKPLMTGVTIVAICLW